MSVFERLATNSLSSINRTAIQVGGFGDDTLTGSSERNLMFGLWGNDRLYGRAGDDFLWGGSGSDRLEGDTDADWLSGGNGNDTLDGGPGINRISGGPGSDRFILDTDSGFDTILDFQDGSDFLLLQDGLTFNQLVFTQVGNDTQIRYLGNSQPSALLLGVEVSSLTEADILTTSLVANFTSLSVFGDSLSDPGNLFALTGNLFPPPPYFNGRFSNGPIWADLFPERFDLTDSQVSNLAIGGATTGRDNGLDSLLGTNLPGVLDQVDQYLGSLGATGADPDGLYVVWAGPNDFFNLPSDPAAIPSVITQAVSNVATAIGTLASRGADTFLIPNLPDLGLLPRTLEAGPAAAVAATGVSLAFNAALATTLSTLEQTLAIDVIEVDIFSLTQELITRSSEFGFTNATAPLIEQIPPSDPNGFFFWDDFHPTARVQELIADRFQTDLFSAGYAVNGEVEEAIASVARRAASSEAPISGIPAYRSEFEASNFQALSYS